MSQIKKQVNAKSFQILGNPPAQYDQNYMQQLVRTLGQFISSVNTGIDLNANSLYMNNLDSSDIGLKPGVVYIKTLVSGEKVLSVVL
jgi:hypothetical protein